ncbi:hypothetical protein PYW07_014483 [Mythimna separata]|uniref:Uncharacterized protein n=1 Tax=Mythimna separata TaxID=271217 RepID=A0AAD7Z1D6_MYTSE|nr:hypothetical protein PYW07_014483 [Mythimna separata]
MTTKMKILCLVVLLVCALARGANVEYEDLPQVESVENHLEGLQFELNRLSPDHEVTEADKLLISELQTSEGQGRSLVADAIADLIEGFRDVVINGNDDIPPLDPLVIPVIGPFDFQAPATTASVTINDFRKEGLRWYVLDKITFNAIRLSFAAHITIPWITVTGTYDARARLGLITHRAGGGFRVFAHRIEVGLDMRVGTNILGGHLFLRELDIRIDIHDTHIQLHGMTGSSIINAFINNYVQNLTQELIQSEMENVSKMLSEELFDVINEILKDYTINDILG